MKTELAKLLKEENARINELVGAKAYGAEYYYRLGRVHGIVKAMSAVK